MKRFAFFDLDGTLRDTVHGVYPCAADVALFEGVRERLKALRAAGFLLVGATNQGGISQGLITRQEVEAANARTQELLGDVRLDHIFYCSHHRDHDGWDCDCKKPGPGMFLDALSMFSGSTLEGAFMVGDMPQDAGAAASVCITFIEAHEFRRMSVQAIVEWASAIEIPPPVRPDPDKVAGTLVGLAVGDALGASLEFLPRSEVRQHYPQPLRKMVASGRWSKGEYTDDTQMALVIADSLLQLRYFDPGAIARGFVAWARSSKDVGMQTLDVLQMAEYVDRPEDCARRYYEQHPNSSAGNGAVMRCAPVALFHLGSPSMLVADSRRSARVTHAAPKVQSSCVVLNRWIAEAMQGCRDARPLSVASLPQPEREVWQRLMQIEKLPEGEVRSDEYTVHTLEAAAWSFLTTDSFEKAVVRAANLGDDAATVAAVTGALAGAYYGYSAIPALWMADLVDAERIRTAALALAGVGKATVPRSLAESGKPDLR
jgi:ADP-ribosyl-[dinitrogen reductase] hydrolase